MLQENCTVFSALAHLLAGSQTDSATISAALELIGKAAALEVGLLYETDENQRLCLAEQYPLCAGDVPQGFSAQEIPWQERQRLAQAGLLYAERGAENEPLEERLLEIYQARVMVLAPVSDTQLHLWGFLLFYTTAEGGAWEETERTTLMALLSMLGHYARGRMYENRLSRNWSTMERLLDNSGIDVYVNDFDTHEILYVNASMAAPYGGKEAFRQQKCWKVLFGERTGPCDFCPKEKLLDEHGEPSQVYSWDYQRPFDGSWFRVFSAAFQWEDGRLAHLVSSADITENKHNEAMIKNLAGYDQLTGLPNRRMLVQECERRIDKATETEVGYVLFFDIDGFKAVNDTLGHDAGDELLIQLGDFFAQIPLLKDSIFRNGGDEFVALIGGETVTRDNIRQLAHFIHLRFGKPWKLKNGDIYCNTSIGVACYPEDGVTAEVLLQKSDQAMYLVKKAGGGGLRFYGG